MGCESEVFTSNCVCDTLLAIVEAQEQVENGCAFSCSTAIQELVGGLSSSPYNTIPVLLYCKSTCDLFVGHGARRVAGGSGIDITHAIAFRVADVDPETCCATLELLQFGTVGYDLATLLGALETDTPPLVRTNTCITVDLNCFCGVTCLPPMTL
ncbi:CotY/CotZ family spore coat protein [Bacillus kwashiorkori]|uniref:CotY/CotZ family spore coat protein n=1 Tax=Bacillus kwashiorkori TaxID=1522318 RepID=UPI00078447B9|nr:CotY/CotZ family spore coat protein [Bacillus kwashiorkori]